MTTAAAILGTAVLLTPAPPPVRIQVTEPACREKHPHGLFDEAVVAGAGGGLKNVFVYVRAGLPPRESPLPDTPVRLLQNGCRYEPRVFGIRAGQPLEIVNADPVSHNIHALAKSGRPFNAGMPGKSKPWSVRRVFSSPEVMVRVRCDVHPWMLCWAGVVTHPWFAVSDADGRFALPPLPPGEYEVAAWHETYGTLARRVRVAAGRAPALRFEFGRKGI